VTDTAEDPGGSPTADTPRWLFRTVIGAVVAGGVAYLFANPPWNKHQAIYLQQPVVAVVTQRSFLASEGIPVGDTPRSTLRRRGAAIRSNLTAKGYKGQVLTIICSVSDSAGKRSGATETHTITVSGKPQTTEPCWVPIPSGAGTYEAELRIEDDHGDEMKVAVRRFRATRA
jgi:hypothetical protein